MSYKKLMDSYDEAFSQKSVSVNPPSQQDLQDKGFWLPLNAHVFWVANGLLFTFPALSCLIGSLAVMHSFLDHSSLIERCSGIFVAAFSMAFFLLVGFLDWHEKFSPLNPRDCQKMLDLIDEVDGGAAYHQKILSQMRPVYGFDRFLLEQVAGVAREHRQAQQEAQCEARTQEQHQAACRRLNAGSDT